MAFRTSRNQTSYGMPRRLGGALSAGLRRGFAVLAMLAALFALPAAAFETTAPTAILVDYGTGRVLYQKDADTEIPPASLAKLMTIAVLFDDLKQGRVQRDDRFVVSQHAWRPGGASS
ncbi:MAG: serine hydrolase, partial [Aurantimonas coralicida]